MKESILIAGGTGLVGTRIVELIDKNKYAIKILSRSDRQGTEYIRFHKWDPMNMTMDEEAVKVDYIINLTGEGIADARWTERRKQSLIESRKKSTLVIGEALQKTGHKPKAYISASAIGYYGDRGAEILTEQSPAGDEFLSDCCEKWESAVNSLSPYVDRIVINRIGLVLSTKGGALPKILMTKMLGVYNYFGAGDQFYSWIHIDDLSRMFIRMVQDDRLSGVYNGVSPLPLTNKKFTIGIKNALKGWLAFPAPAFALRLVLGEMANVVLNSNRVVPKRLEATHFSFEFTDLQTAVKDLVKRKV